MSARILSGNPVVPPTKRVLIVEDNPGVGMYASLLIEMSQMAVPTLIADGLEGLLACFRESPHALVLDLDLPTMQGEDILRFLRASSEHRHLPILIISALPEARRRELDLLRMGADAYLEKPIIEGVFLDTLRRLLDRPTPPPGTSLADSFGVPPSHAFIAAALKKELQGDFPSPVSPRAASPALAAKAPEKNSAPAPMGVSNAAPPENPSQAPPPVLPLRAPAPRPAKDATQEAERTGKIDPKASVFQGYRLLKIVGAGGMGTVYKAEQISLQRIVALKVLLENLHQNPSIRERFARESQIMAQVNHPNIVQVFETGKTENTSYFSMEFVDGYSLARHITKSTLEWVECIEVIRQTCDAIAHLHSRGIIHRDIKPSNILLSRWGQVKITDFGISRARLVTDMGDYTKISQFMGTPEYMAPELSSLSQASEQTDLFALGMTFWRMFAGPDVRTPGAPLHEVRPEIPQALSGVIARCIAPEPENRFEAVLDVRDAILAACKEISPPASIPKTPPGQPVGKS